MKINKNDLHVKFFVYVLFVSRDHIASNYLISRSPTRVFDKDRSCHSPKALCLVIATEPAGANHHVVNGYLSQLGISTTKDLAILT